MDKEKKPTIAPGSDNLEKHAKPEEVARGDSTKVTTMSWDEVDPSHG